jgi:hypothetical protein
MQALLIAAMVWISGATGLPVPSAVPGVVYVTPREMATLAHPEGDYDSTMARSYLALYHARSGTILLRHGWDADDLRDRSVLVHELVHHMQATAGRTYPCRGARERVAYDAQARWLEERGGDLFEVLGLNALFYHALTRC